MLTEGRISLFVFIDALGFNLAQRANFFAEHTVLRFPVTTIFGYSSTCDPTILTGTLPREHGHFAFYLYDPQHSPFGWYRWLSVLPKSITSRGRVRARLSSILKRVHGFTGYFQLYNMPFDKLHLFDYSEKRNIFEEGGINGGQPTIFDFLRENDIPHFRSQSYSESETINALHKEIDRGEIRFGYLFLGKLDAILHAEGTRSPQVAQHLGWYEKQLSAIIEHAQSRYDEVRMFVFSDHGMTDVTDTCDLIGRVEKLGLKFGEDYAAVYDSTMARFWFFNQVARDAIVNTLKEEDRGSVVPKDNLEEWGCDFPEDRYGELFFLMKPGVLICPSYMGQRPLAGMHGYEPNHEDSTATFMSNVEVTPVPRRLDDLYALMRREVEPRTGA